MQKSGVGGADDLVLREPELGDGKRVWQLARDTGLDLNSPYAYLLFCDRFRATSLLAESQGQLVGFVLGFVPPDARDAVFVWQIGVDESVQGRGLGACLLDRVAERHRAAGGTHLEATVTPSNHASLRLFRALARRLEAPCRECVQYRPEDFPSEQPHEAELLLRIGAFGTRRQRPPAPSSGLRNR